MWEKQCGLNGKVLSASAVITVDGVEYAVLAERKWDGDRVMVRRLGRSDRAPYGVCIASAAVEACLSGDMPPSVAFDYAIENMSPEARAYALGYGR